MDFWVLVGENRDFRPQIRILREKLCYQTDSQVCRAGLDPQNSEKKIYIFATYLGGSLCVVLMVLEAILVFLGVVLVVILFTLLDE